MQKCEGRVGPHPPHTWALWFRHTFKLSQACRVELELQLPGEALLKAASLVLLDNDTSQVLSSAQQAACSIRPSIKTKDLLYPALNSMRGLFYPAL